MKAYIFVATQGRKLQLWRKSGTVRVVYSAN